ncbi:hypothetical protein HMPREF1545_02258 [Oscillibacter sp. KLE 1728]|nr:hypothetical protein HMPREF1545_02258 [Oscillibacter sp. KLE 1728]ERK64657.1 hypothetical protein HMPREF1546_01645 [Oscillibacter sp. KLE 1745]
MAALGDPVKKKFRPPCNKSRCLRVIRAEDTNRNHESETTSRRSFL